MPFLCATHSSWTHAYPGPWLWVYSPDPAPTEQGQTVHKLVSVRSGSARSGPARVLILRLSEDPALNSSRNTGKCSNWGIFYIINSDEQPSYSPTPLPLHSFSLHLSLPHHSPALLIFFSDVCIFPFFPTFTVFVFILSHPKHSVPFPSILPHVCWATVFWKVRRCEKNKQTWK